MELVVEMVVELAVELVVELVVGLVVELVVELAVELVVVLVVGPMILHPELGHLSQHPAQRASQYHRTVSDNEGKCCAAQRKHKRRSR